MATLYLTEQGSALGKEGQRLVVRKGDETLADVPIIKIDQVVVFGNVSLSTPALGLLMARDVDVVFLSLDGRYKGRLTGPGTGNGALRQAQYRRSLDADFALRTARAIVRSKLLNQHALLTWAGQVFAAWAGDARLVSERAAPAASAALADALRRIEAVDAQAQRLHDIEALRGLEGAGAAAYFQALKSLLRQGMGFEGRRKRPPPDPVNAMLSYGYTVLTNRMSSWVEAVGLDLYVGFFHGLKYNRPAMALDLVEAFRAPVVDWVVLRAVNRRDLTPEDFEPGKDEEGRATVLMTDAARARYLTLYETRMATKIVHPRSGNAETFARCLELDARAMAHAIGAGTPFLAFTLPDL